MSHEKRVIENAESLEQFRKEVRQARALTSERPLHDSWLSYFDHKAACYKRCSENERIFNRIPEEVEIPKEIAMVLFAQYAAAHGNWKGAVNALCWPDIDPTKLLVKAGMTVAFPSLERAISLVKEAVMIDGVVAYNTWQEKEIFKKFKEELGPLVRDLLDNYKLKVNEEGRYLLTRGNWDVDEEIVSVGRMRRQMLHHSVVLADTGIDQSVANMEAPELQKKRPMAR